jgi:N-acetylneuraminic acid mutarotase
MSSMPTARSLSAAVGAANQRIYAMGGGNSSGTLNTVEEYNPATNTWAVRASMPTARLGLGLVAASNGKIYAIGGATDISQSSVLATVEEYDPLTNTWVARSSMPTARRSFGITVGADGKIYVIGGMNGAGALNTVEAYDPATDKWSSRASMPTARFSLAAERGSNGKIYAIGGQTTAVVEEYDPLQNTWTARTPMSAARWNIGSAVSGGRIYIIGGQWLGPAVVSYDPLTDTWRNEPSLISPERICPSGAATTDGVIYAIGGHTAEGALNSIEALVTDVPAPSYSITGKITTSDLTGVPGVSVSNGSQTVLTDSNGHFSFTNMGSGTYTITPSLAGYSFTPASRTVTITASLSNQDFTATAMTATPIPPTATSVPPTSTPIPGNILFSDDFSGELKNWTVISGTWGIDAGRLKGVGHGGQIDGYLYAGDQSWTDYALTTRVYFDDGEADLILRSTGHWQNEYRLTLWTPSTYELIRYTNGVPEHITGNTYDASPVPFTNPSDVRVELTGSRIRVFINNALMVDFTDPQPLLAGQFGLGVIWSYQVHYDDVVVTGISAPAPTAPPGVPPTATPVHTPTATKTPISSTPTAIPSPIPGNIQVTAVSGFDQIMLKWTPSVNPSVTHYQILRASPPFNFVYAPIATTSNTPLYDTTAGLTQGRNYCYKVEAYSAGTLVETSQESCAVFGRINIWIPDSYASQNDTLTVPVNVRNARGLNIASADIWMSFDPSVLEVQSVSNTSMTSAFVWDSSLNNTTGTIKISTISSPAKTIYGDGSLFWVTFKVKGELGATSNLDLHEYVFLVGGSSIQTENDQGYPVDIPLSLSDGVFTVQARGKLGDVDESGVVAAADALLALKMAVGTVLPTTKQLYSADVNGDGVITSADVTMILYYAVNGTWPLPPEQTSMPVFRLVNQPAVVISLDAITGAPGSIVQTTVRAANLTNWAGGDWVITYDPKVVSQVTGVTVTGLSRSAPLAFKDDGKGQLKISIARNTPVSGDGAIAILTLKLADKASTNAAPLALADVRLADPYGRDFVTSATQGTIERRSASVEIKGAVFLPMISR